MFKRFKKTGAVFALFLACLFLFSCVEKPTPVGPDTSGSGDSSSVTAVETEYERIPTKEKLQEYYEAAKTEFEKLAMDGWGLKGVTEFPYYEKALAGEIDLSKPKLTFEDVERLKKQYDNVQDILDEIDRIQPDCDVRLFPTQEWRFYLPNYTFEKGIIMIPIDTIRSPDDILVSRQSKDSLTGVIPDSKASQDDS